MRTIKFRGKRIDNGKWAIGDLRHHNDGSVTIITNLSVWSDNDDDVDAYGEELRVVPETVGQYTGMKDKNGKDVWEGDIVSIVYEDYINYGDDICEDCYGTGVVEYNEYTGCFEVHIIEGDGCVMNDICYDDGFSWTFYSIVISETRVVGNFFDNPELLKGGQDG